jgi:hypothetical protein
MKSLYALIVILALCYSLATVGQTQNQQPAPESTRHLVVKVAPEYPESAKRLRLGGTVKVVAVVGTDGKVKRVQTVGKGCGSMEVRSGQRVRRERGTAF